jgi:hypothetical protein
MTNHEVAAEVDLVEQTMNGAAQAIRMYRKQLEPVLETIEITPADVHRL